MSTGPMAHWPCVDAACHKPFFLCGPLLRLPVHCTFIDTLLYTICGIAIQCNENMRLLCGLACGMAVVLWDMPWKQAKHGIPAAPCHTVRTHLCECMTSGLLLLPSVPSHGATCRAASPSLHCCPHSIQPRAESRSFKEIPEHVYYSYHYLVTHRPAHERARPAIALRPIDHTLSCG